MALEGHCLRRAALARARVEMQQTSTNFDACQDLLNESTFEAPPSETSAGRSAFRQGLQSLTAVRPMSAH
jgi:hypothetical protein